MVVKPFRGVRPRPDLASRIPSLPYDVLESDEARRLAADDPYTFLHVVKPEVDLDPTADVHGVLAYAKARENFDRMRTLGWLVRDPVPAYYLYRQRMGGHAQTGIVGASSIDDYLEGRIKRHEHTRPDKEDDRTRHTEALGANAGPVLLAYRAHPALAALIAERTAGAPAADFEAPDGVEHAVWIADDPPAIAAIETAFRDVTAEYIADGHHRAAAYARVGTTRRARVGRYTGDEPFNGFLAVHVPAHELKILDYNRVVRDLHGKTPAAFLTAVQDAGFDVVAPWPAKRPPGAGSFGLYLAGEWRLLSIRPGTRRPDDPVLGLDVAVLQDRILAPLLGIEDPRTDDRLTFVGGIRGLDELERRVDRGGDSAAFVLHPVSIDDVMRVADAGKVTPPKATWFEPKLRSGLVVRLLDEA